MWIILFGKTFLSFCERRDEVKVSTVDGAVPGDSGRLKMPPSGEQTTAASGARPQPRPSRRFELGIRKPEEQRPWAAFPASLDVSPVGRGRL